MLINTFKNSERAYSQDSWILIRPLHFLAAASTPATDSLENVYVLVSMETELDDHTPILSPIEHWYNVPTVFWYQNSFSISFDIKIVFHVTLKIKIIKIIIDNHKKLKTLKILLW